MASLCRLARSARSTVAARPASFGLWHRPPSRSAWGASGPPPKKGVVVETFSALRARELQEAGWKAYPNHYPTTATIGELVAKYDSLEAGARVKDVDVRICGRITKKRESSKKLIFYEVTTSEGTMQIMASAGSYDGDFLVNRYLRKGDIIGVRGIMGKTNLGELSVIPKELFLLSPCLHELPEQLIDVNTRFRQRYLDFLVNQRNRETFVARAKMLAALRQHLQQKNFLEVETPILWTQSGGASARPFTTRSNAIGNDMDLYMRIAPELFLKELVIGGMDRVFEIGKLFRNEGIDATHNPEFTSCEFYQAYAGLDDLFVTTQDILRDIVQAVTGGSTVTLQDGTVVDFAQDFQRIEIMPALAEKLGRPLPDPNDDASLPEYEEICNSLHLRVTAPATLPRCLDKLIGHFLEPLCVQPTFLTHHPNCLSPLAKSSSISPGLTQRFELFVGCQELCNAYEELNDPEEQRSRLQKQANMASAGDDEAQPPDEHFCTALSYGLPPTAGWGMGLDRLCMLLTGNMHIREVLLFPVYRPEQSDTDKTDVPV